MCSDVCYSGLMFLKMCCCLECIARLLYCTCISLSYCDSHRHRRSFLTWFSALGVSLLLPVLVVDIVESNRLRTVLGVKLFFFNNVECVFTSYNGALELLLLIMSSMLLVLLFVQTLCTLSLDLLVFPSQKAHPNIVSIANREPVVASTKAVLQSNLF